MNILIIDDETHARDNLRKRLINIDPEINIIGEAANAKSARKLINDNTLDLIFLDIEMPKENGFDLLSSLPQVNFDIIFVTAYNEYALKAFQNHALGYITKPIDNEALAIAYQKAKQLRKPTIDALLLKTLTDEIKNKSTNNKVAIPVETGLEMIDKQHIVLLESQDGYTALHLENGKLMYSSKRFKYFEEQLDSKQFIRIHRSYMVNISYIMKYHKIGAVSLTDGRELAVSRKYKNSVAQSLLH